jgi:hypothetical protein
MPTIKSRLIAIRLAGLGIITIGTYIPIVRTNSGLTYSIVGTPGWMIGFVLAVAALLAIFSNDIPESISKKTNWISISLLAIVCVYAILHFKDGLNYFLFQSVGNMANNPEVNNDQYWSTLYALTGMTNKSIPMFGDLRTLYKQFGDQLTVNDQYLFWDIINALSKEDARKLISLSGGEYFVFPAGIILMLIGSLAYSFPMRLLQWAKNKFPLIFPK